jgi:signal transduction histidine kinase
MQLTVRESVSKMKVLLERLHGTAANQGGGSGTDIVVLLKGLAERKKRAGAAVVLNVSQESLVVQGDGQALGNVFEHVIQNAQDATAEAGKDIPVQIDVTEQENKIEIAVTDQGTGMDEEFVRHELFKPFRSTKEGGYGIGVYESREIVREAGGDFSVVSEVGQGTRITIRLKKAVQEDAAPKQFELEEK